jgi:hypothetical protein
VRLVALQPNLGRPQFLTSDRHITQGAVGLEDIKWDGSRLTASISAVAGFSQVLRFAMPKGKMPSRVTAVNATVKTSIEFYGAVVAVEVLSQATGTVNVSLEF